MNILCEYMGFENVWEINILKMIRILTVIFISMMRTYVNWIDFKLNYEETVFLMLYIFAIRLTLEGNKKGYTVDIVQNNKSIHG